MKIKLKSVLVLLLLCVACTNVKETPKGLKYTVVKKGDGVTVKPDEYILAYLFFKDSKDSVWLDSRKSGYPTPIMIPDTSQMKREDVIADLFRHLSKGDSVTFTMQAKELFEKTFKQQMPPKVDPMGNFVFSIGVTDVINKEQFVKLQAEMREKRTAEEAKRKVIQLGKDTVAIDSFLTVKKIQAIKTPSGLRYVIHKEGTGPKFVAGQKAVVEYVGSVMLTGKVFDTSNEAIGKASGLKNPAYRPLIQDGGKPPLIHGMEEALPLMNKGEKITIYVPSTLAYGARRASDVIVANSILQFEMEMVDINRETVEDIKKKLKVK